MAARVWGGWLMSIDPMAIPVIAIVGGLAVAALGIVTEARAKERKSQARFSDADAAGFASAVDRLEWRMKVLEAILDDEVPGWRRKYDD